MNRSSVNDEETASLLLFHGKTLIKTATLANICSIEYLYTKGLFAWVLAVQPKSGLSLVYLKKELFKFTLTASIMALCMSSHSFQDITYKSFAVCSASSTQSANSLDTVPTMQQHMGPHILNQEQEGSLWSMSTVMPEQGDWWTVTMISVLLE